METTAKKPVGGFVFVSATGLLAAWWAYKRRFIQFRDFRAWLACHELLAQRCGLQKGQVPHFKVEELGALVGGVGGEHLRASLRRLERAGLLAWSQTTLRFATSVSDVRVGDTEDLDETVQRVTNHRRRVPVPRRLLKLMTRESRPVFVATALGHLLRCMYSRNQMCRGDGRCKASWVANVFEVDERNVKAARKELLEQEWLFRRPDWQRAMNRWGPALCFNFSGGEKGPRGTPPRSPVPTTGTPPPRRTGNSSFGRSENQKPGCTGASGVRMRTNEKPTWTHIIHPDLQDPLRLHLLYEAAALAGFVRPSESGQLFVFAAAIHARRVAKQNACGLFASVVKRRLDVVSQGDEDAARRCLQGWKFGGNSKLLPYMHAGYSPATLSTNGEGPRPSRSEERQGSGGLVVRAAVRGAGDSHQPHRDARRTVGTGEVHRPQLWSRRLPEVDRRRQSAGQADGRDAEAHVSAPERTLRTGPSRPAVPRAPTSVEC